MAGSSSSDHRALLKFALPDGKQLWDFGRRENWNAFSKFLDSISADDFRVVDEAAELTLADVRKRFDSECCGRRRGFVQTLVGRGGGENAELLKRALALGAHPDLQDDFSWRPSHSTGCYALVESARAVCACRPSLTATNMNMDTPRGAAARTYTFNTDAEKYHDALKEKYGKLRPLIVDVWQAAETRGFPSIAALAADKSWWAVKNLCRRRVIKDEEALMPHDGKTALEWAEAHGELEMAAELRYFFRYPLMLQQMKQFVEDRLAAEVTDVGKEVKQDDLLAECALLSSMKMDEKCAELEAKVEKALDEKEQAFKMHLMDKIGQEVPRLCRDICQRRGATSFSDASARSGTKSEAGPLRNVFKLLVKQIEDLTLENPSVELATKLADVLDEFNPAV